MQHPQSPASDETLLRCAYSGEMRPRIEMVQIGEHWIAVDKKDACVEFLQQGGELENLHLQVETPLVPGFTALFSSAWKIYRTRFGVIAALYLTVWLPCDLFVGYVEKRQWLGETITGTFRFNTWMDALFGVIATGAILHVTRAAYEGRMVSYREALSVGLQKWGVMLRAQLLINFASGIGILLLIIPGLLVLIRSVFVPAIIMEHNESATNAFDSSWRIAKGHFWRIAGFTLVVGVAAAMPTMILTFFSSGVQSLAEQTVESSFVLDQLWLLDWLAESIGGITVPFITIFCYIFYRVLRAEADRILQRSRPPIPVPGTRPMRPVTRPPQPPKSPFPPPADSGNLPA